MLSVSMGEMLSKNMERTRTVEKTVEDELEEKGYDPSDFGIVYQLLSSLCYVAISYGEKKIIDRYVEVKELNDGSIDVKELKRGVGKFIDRFKRECKLKVSVNV